jgi:hypothetical protein
MLVLGSSNGCPEMEEVWRRALMRFNVETTTPGRHGGVHLINLNQPAAYQQRKPKRQPRQK